MPEHNREPKISELETLLKAFREGHGEEALLKEMEYFKEKASNLFFHDEKQVPDNTPSEEHFVYSSGNADNSSAPKVHFGSTQPEKEKEYIPRSKPERKKIDLKKKRYKYPLLIGSAFLLIYLFFNLPTYYARLTYNTTTTNTTILKQEETVQKKMSESAALNPGEVIPVESRIVIPKLSVNAPIIFVDSRAEEDIQKGLEKGVVHYQGTANPGDIGNSFITGHSSNYWWSPGKYNYVFVLLDKMETGDQVITYYNGKKFVYTVREKIVVEPTEVSVLLPTETPTMTLMTCTPPGTSWKRLILKLDRTDPAYYAPEKVVTEKVVQIPLESKRSLWSKIVSFFIPN